MKILAISDIDSWCNISTNRDGSLISLGKTKTYEQIFNETNPDVVVLAGDLISDGFARFWEDAIEMIPDYQKELKVLMKRYGVTYGKNYNSMGRKQIIFDFNKINITVIEWNDVIFNLQQKYRKTEEFDKNRNTLHTIRFYDFLKHAGKKSTVLVVKGNHDDDFKGDYETSKINEIEGCIEISGKLVEIDNIFFLGLGFDETHYLKKLKPLIEKHKNNVDIIITHAEQNKISLLSSLNSQLIIRGHFGSGKYLVNQTLAVFTSRAYYSIIQFDSNRKPKIKQYSYLGKLIKQQT